MISFFKRNGTKPTKCTVYIEIGSISFSSKDGLELQPSGTFFSVVFQRNSGGIVYTSGRKAEVLTDGSVTIGFDETLSQNVTLYREFNGNFQEKVAKLIIRRRIKAGNFDECFKRVGVVNLQLHQFAKKNTPEHYTLEIAKADAQGGQVDVTVTMKFLGDPPVNYNDLKNSPSSSSLPNKNNRSPNKSFGHNDDDDDEDSNAFLNDSVLTEDEKRFREAHRPKTKATDPFENRNNNNNNNNNAANTTATTRSRNGSIDPFSSNSRSRNGSADPFSEESFNNPFARKPPSVKAPKQTPPPPPPPVPTIDPFPTTTISDSSAFSNKNGFTNNNSFNEFSNFPTSIFPSNNNNNDHLFPPTNVVTSFDDDDSQQALSKPSKPMKPANTNTNNNNNNNNLLNLSSLNDAFLPSSAPSMAPPAPPPLPPRNPSMLGYGNEARDRQNSVNSQNSSSSLTPSEKAFRDSRRPSQLVSSANSSPEKRSVDMYGQETDDEDPFNELSAAISEAENSSNIFKKTSKPPSSSSSSTMSNNDNNNSNALPKQTTSQSLHGALAKLSRTDEESRHFMEEKVPEHLKDFIEAPTFSSLNSFDAEDSRKSSASDPFGSFTLQPSQPSQYNDPFAFNESISIDDIQQVNVNTSHKQNKSPEQYIQQARSKREAESNQLDQQKNNMIVDTSNNSQSSNMNQPQSQPQPQNPPTINNSPLTAPPPNPQPLTHLSPEYDVQAQQAAYFAMQAQLEQGVVFNSEDDQQAAYQSYYIYYSQYYLQIQQQAQSQEHQEYYDRAHVETQAMIDQLTSRAQEAEANLNKCQQELLLANQKLASSGSMDIVNNEKYKELEASRKELNDLKAKEKQFQSMYGELESWKAKCEQLSLQLASAAKNNTLDTKSPKGQNSDNNTVNLLTKQLESEKEQTSRLKAKLKRFGERIASMEVQLAEAQISKSHYPPAVPNNLKPISNQQQFKDFNQNINDDEYNLM